MFLKVVPNFASVTNADDVLGTGWLVKLLIMRQKQKMRTQQILQTNAHLRLKTVEKLW